MSDNQNSIFKNTNLFIIFSITLAAVMGVSSITPAFPQIIEHYNLSVKQIGYLITIFTVPGVVLTPFIGILADRLGRKTILFPALLLFGIAGPLCAIQKNYESLLIMRFFQGIGAASLGSLNATLIGDIFQGEKRIQAMGYNASILSIGTASFPAIGGLLAFFNWHFVFLLPVLVVPLAFVVLFKLESPAIKNDVNLKKYLGKVWNTINRKKVWGLFSINILVFIILYGALLSFFPLLMKERFDADSLRIGIMMSVMSIITAICASQLNKIRKKISANKLLIFSSAIYGLALISLSFATNWFLLGFSIVLFGVGHGFFMPNIQTTLVGLAPISERAAFMSLNGMVLRIGQTLGPIVVAMFYIQENIANVFLLTAGIPVIMILIILTIVGKLE